MLDTPGVGLLISLLSFVAAVAIPLYVYRRQRRDKGLAYELSTATLASLHSKARERVRVLFEGHPVEEVALVTVRVRNTGSEPVLPRDFQGPLTIRLDAREALLDHFVGECVPADLRPHLVDTASGVAILPLLLNPDDRFEVSLLVDATALSRVFVTGRIAGIHQIKLDPPAVNRAASLSTQLRRLTLGGATVASLAGASAAILAAGIADEPRKEEILPGGRMVSIDNRVTSGLGMREDSRPARLSVLPAVCRTDASRCFVTDARFRSGDEVPVRCWTRGERLTNGEDWSRRDDDNPQLASSTRWYGVRTTAGRLGYISEIWVAPRDRGGLGLPRCPPA